MSDDSWYDFEADGIGSYNDAIAAKRIRLQREVTAATMLVPQLLYELRRILNYSPPGAFPEARRLVKQIESEATL